MLTKKEVVVPTDLSLLLLPHLEREVVKVYTVIHPETLETVVFNAPLLFPRKEDLSFVAGNGQAVQLMKSVVLERHETVCVDLADCTRQGLRFTIEFFFYMNDVKVAFFRKNDRRYEILYGAPKKGRDEDRGVLEELYPL